MRFIINDEQKENAFVIDSDCLLKLDKKIQKGNEILDLCKIYIPKNFIYELSEKYISSLKNKYDLETIEFDEEDHELISDYLKKIYRDKNIKTNYLRRPESFKAPHLGECQAAAIAKKMKIPLVMMEKNNIHIFKRLKISVIHIKEFGLNILVEKEDQDTFLSSLWEKENIK